MEYVKQEYGYRNRVLKVPSTAFLQIEIVNS